MRVISTRAVSTLPARTVREFIDLAKAQPGKLNYGSTGIGGSNHIVTEVFNVTAGIRLTHVPYKGPPQALADLAGNQVQLVFASITSGLPLARAGKVRAVAVTSLKRSPNVPELPTMVEAGLVDFEAISWFGLLAPVGTSPAVVAKLHQEAVRIVSQPDMREKFGLIGLDVVGDSPDVFAAIIRSDTVKWAKVIKEAGIKAAE